MEFKNILPVCFILLKRKNNHAPLKNSKNNNQQLFFRFSPYTCYPSSHDISRKKEYSVPLPSFITLLGRKVYFMAMCCYKILKYLGCYLARNYFSSRKHLSIKISKCEEVKLISLSKANKTHRHEYRLSHCSWVLLPS